MANGKCWTNYENLWYVCCMPIHAYTIVFDCTWFALSFIGLFPKPGIPPIALWLFWGAQRLENIHALPHRYMVCTWEAGKSSVNSWGPTIRMSSCRHPSMPSCWVDIVQRSNGRNTSTAERRRDSPGLGKCWGSESVPFSRDNLDNLQEARETMVVAIRSRDFLEKCHEYSLNPNPGICWTWTKEKTGTVSQRWFFTDEQQLQTCPIAAKKQGKPQIQTGRRLAMAW